MDLLHEAVARWPLGILDTAGVLLGTLLLAKATNLAWERRELFSLMSRDEWRALLGLLSLIAIAGALWVPEIGPGPVLVICGAAVREIGQKVVEFGDAGRLGATWEDIGDDDDV